MSVGEVQSSPQVEFAMIGAQGAQIKDRKTGDDEVLESARRLDKPQQAPQGDQGGSRKLEEFAQNHLLGN